MAKAVVLTLLKLVPLGVIVGRAGFCKLWAVAVDHGIQQPEVAALCAPYPDWHLVSAQNLRDWSGAWATHWNARLAPLVGVGFVALTGTHLLVLVGLLELAGFVSLFTSPLRGGLMLAAVMAGALDTHLSSFGQGVSAVLPQIACLFVALLIALNAPPPPEPEALGKTKTQAAAAGQQQKMRAAGGKEGGVGGGGGAAPEPAAAEGHVKAGVLVRTMAYFASLVGFCAIVAALGLVPFAVLGFDQEATLNWLHTIGGAVAAFVGPWKEQASGCVAAHSSFAASPLAALVCFHREAPLTWLLWICLFGHLAVSARLFWTKGCAHLQATCRLFPLQPSLTTRTSPFPPPCALQAQAPGSLLLQPQGR